MLENFIILNNLDANQKTNNINLNPVNKNLVLLPHTILSYTIKTFYKS